MSAAADRPPQPRQSQQPRQPRRSGPPGRNLYDVERVRAEFPILDQEVNGRPLAYLDNGATSQKPRQVIDTLRRYYEADNANIHRGLHALSERATSAYEGARDTVRAFLNAADRREIVFVRGATEGLNLVAQGWARPRLRPDDEIVTTTMEHHSNIVPWQLVCRQTGARLRVAPIHDSGELDMEAFASLLNERTRVVAAAHVSNALGTVNPVREIVEAAHAAGAVAVLDGAQAAPHCAVDVRAIGCDFYTFSSHKTYGPTGMGVLYGRAERLEEAEPYQGGGDMIRTVSFEGSTWNDLPYKFEAGTPNIAGTIGLGAAVEFMTGLGMDAIAAHEHDVLEYATEALDALDGVRIVGTAREKAGILSFIVEGVHPHDVGTIVDQHGVAIRAGHHCAMPLMRRYRVPALSRASLGLYNTRADIDALVEGLRKVKEIFDR